MKRIALLAGILVAASSAMATGPGERDSEGGITSSGDPGDCLQAPSVVGKSYTRPLLSEQQCEEQLSMGYEISCSEYIEFEADRVSLLFGGTDMIDMVPYTQCGTDITIKVSEGMLYRDQADRKTRWQLSADGRTLTNVVEGIVYRRKD